MCIRLGDSLLEPPSRRTCSVAENMQAAEGLCQLAVLQPPGPGSPEQPASGSSKLGD